jgi:hypothetical protein
MPNDLHLKTLQSLVVMYENALRSACTKESLALAHAQCLYDEKQSQSPPDPEELKVKVIDPINRTKAIGSEIIHFVYNHCPLDATDQEFGLWADVYMPVIDDMRGQELHERNEAAIPATQRNGATTQQRLDAIVEALYAADCL